ncbi:MAG: hypothetical protein AB1894_23795 [Chloroflexota bacterium]
MVNYDPVYLTFNQKPGAIVRGMDEMVAQGERLQNSQKQRRWVPRLLFLAGFPFILLDGLLRVAGYQVCLFSLIAPVCWLASLVLGLSMRRSRALELAPLFTSVRQVIYTLRDDANPKRNFFGHLDLTGTQTKEKLARENSDSFGRVTQLYRDEWLSLKTKLYDGNALRLSAIRREKVRKGYWKRGAISGKTKWKAPKFKGSLQELRLRLSVNPQVYDTANIQTMPVGAQIGPYVIERLDASGGIIDLAAATGSDRITDNDILSVLKAVYDLLKRRDVQ